MLGEAAQKWQLVYEDFLLVSAFLIFYSLALYELASMFCHVAPDSYTLKKKVGYFKTFTKYFFKKHAKNTGEKFAKPRLDAACLDKDTKKCFKAG